MLDKRTKGRMARGENRHRRLTGRPESRQDDEAIAGLSVGFIVLDDATGATLGRRLARLPAAGEVLAGLGVATRVERGRPPTEHDPGALTTVWVRAEE